MAEKSTEAPDKEMNTCHRVRMTSEVDSEEGVNKILDGDTSRGRNLNLSISEPMEVGNPHLNLDVDGEDVDLFDDGVFKDIQFFPIHTLNLQMRSWRIWIPPKGKFLILLR